MAFYFYDPALELKIREVASKVTDEEVLRAINESMIVRYGVGIYVDGICIDVSSVKMSDLTKKDREDIRFEIAVARCGGSTMHGPLSSDSLQNHRIWSRAARRESKLKNHITVFID